jgi:hypothetical protein
VILAATAAALAVVADAVRAAKDYVNHPDFVAKDRRRPGPLDADAGFL